MTNVQNNFVTKFLVEYAVKNSGQIEKQSKLLDTLGQNASNTATIFSRFAEHLKEQGVQGKQATKILDHFAKSYKQLGYEIGKAPLGSHSDALQLLDPSKKGKKKGVEYMDAMSKTMKDLEAQMKPVTEGSEGWAIAQDRLQNKLKQFRKNGIDASITTHRFMSNMEDAGYYVNRSGDFINKTTGRVEKLDRVAKTSSSYSLKEFRAAFLGIMFIAQQVSSTFGGMVNSVLQTVGIFDMFKSVLVGILMPVLAPLIKEYLPKIMDWLKDPAHRKFLGTMILWIATIAPLVAFLSQIKILLGSLGIGKLLLLGTKGLKGLTKWTTILTNLIAFFAVIGNLIGVIGSLLNKDVGGALYSILGVAAGIGAMLAGGWVAGLLAALAALIMFGKKIGVVRGLVMALLTPFVKVANAILHIVDLIRGVGWNESHKRSKAWMRNWNQNMAANFKAGSGKAVPMAKGGIVTSPTLALIGEAGPEAVVPLNNSTNMNYSPTLNVNGGSMNNFEADRFAKRINERLWFDARRYGGV